MSPATRGWIVTFAGLGINLALGVLYTWSVVAKALTKPAAEGGAYLWTAQQANWPYAFAVGTFALTMVFAGRLQDRIGPRWVATAGGVMVGLGMVVASFSPTRLQSDLAFPWAMVLGFGVLTGIGIGLAYASATPAAVKWFAPRRKGLITGIVVAGFGLASLYTAPLTAFLIKGFGVNRTFLFMGIGFLAVIVILAQMLANPMQGYVPPGSYAEPPGGMAPKQATREFTWQEMVRTPSFYVLWFMYAFAAFAGLMIVGIMAKVATVQLGKETATTMSYVLVATLALGNGAGRPLSGLLSDRIGRQRTMLIVFVFQALMMLALGAANTVPMLMTCAFFIGFNYGANLTLFPATTFDFFGTKNGGANYGLVFTAWGVGGVFGSQLAAFIFDHSKTAAAPGGSYVLAFWIAACLLGVASALTFVARAPADSPPARANAADVVTTST
jgi:OFA family oxalate/formate antiporter-like MFS transporter